MTTFTNQSLTKTAAFLSNLITTGISIEDVANARDVEPSCPHCAELESNCKCEDIHD